MVGPVLPAAAIAGMGVLPIVFPRVPDPLLAVDTRGLPPVSMHVVPTEMRLPVEWGIPPNAVWVVHERTAWRAFSNCSPHFGCQVEWPADRQLFVDVCSSGMWDLLGGPVAGTAPSSLDWFPVKAEGHRLLINLGQGRLGP